MRTQEIPDDDFDDLFRKASEKHVEEFDPEAWRQMEKLLDKEGGRGGAFPWWRGLWLLLGLMVLGTLGIWYAAQPVQDQRDKVADKEPRQATDPQLAQSKEVLSGRKQPADPAEVPPAAQENSPTDEKERRSGNPANGNENPEDSENGEGDNTMTGQDQSVHKPVGKRPETEILPGRLPQSLAAKQRRQPGVAPESDLTEPANVPAEPGRKKGRLRGWNQPNGNQQRNSLMGQKPVPRRQQESNQNIEPGMTEASPAGKKTNVFAGDRFKPQEEVPGPEEMVEIQNASTLRANETVYDLLTGKNIAVVQPELRAGTVPAPEETPYFIERPPAEKPYRLSAALMLSPDISSVGFFHDAMPGTNAGARLAYRLTNRFTMRIGLVHSVKIYSAKPEDYHPPYGTWSYGRQPSSIEAKCKILDVPVDLRVDVVRQPRYTLFVSSGLSSYIMLSERYDYTYDVPNPRLIQSWKGRTTDRFKFSVYTVSAGYERQLGKRLSWQVEPFLKLPLSGVGFGKVKLLSTGIFLTARYNLLR